MTMQEQEKDWLAEHARNLASAPSGWATFQSRVHHWVVTTFGIDAAFDARERCHRFLEEALELVQSLDCTASEAHQLVDYVFGRPVGAPSPELGGAMVCLAALATAKGYIVEDSAEVELRRNWQNAAKIHEKWLAKPKHSPLLAKTSPPFEPLPARTVAQWFLDNHQDIDLKHLDAITDLVRRARNDGAPESMSRQIPHIVINEAAHGME